MNQNIVDFLPKCPYCKQSFYQPNFPAYQLACNHYVCLQCLPKLDKGAYYFCYFDRTQSLKSVQAYDLFPWLRQVCEYNAWDVATVDPYLKHYLPYTRSCLPCPNSACGGQNCEFSHTNPQSNLGDCPLQTRCTTSATCVFRHQKQQMMNSDFYSEVTRIKDYCPENRDQVESQAQVNILPQQGYHPNPASPSIPVALNALQQYGQGGQGGGESETVISTYCVRCCHLKPCDKVTKVCTQCSTYYR